MGVIQEHTLALWPWEERWSREEWTMLPELARAPTLSWPHFFFFVFFFSQLLLLWFFLVYELDFHGDSSTFLFFFVHLLWVSSVFYGIMLLHIHMMSHNISFSVPPQCVLWQWETVWSVSKPNPSMAQKSQHAAIQPCPALCLEHPSLHLHRQVTQIICSLHYHTQCYTLKSNPKIQMNNSGLPLSFFTLKYTSSFALFQYSLVNQKELYPLSCPPTTTKCYCISSCYYITALVAICDTRQGLLSLPLWFDTVVSSKVMLFFPEPGVKAHL